MQCIITYYDVFRKMITMLINVDGISLHDMCVDVEKVDLRRFPLWPYLNNIYYVCRTSVSLSTKEAVFNFFWCTYYVH